MGNELFFEIPDDVLVVVKLIEAVPSACWWMSGFLYASPDQVAKGDIEKEARIIAYSDSIEVSRQGFFAVVTGAKKPGLIEFRCVGHQRNNFDLTPAKHFLATHVENGYQRGHLDFFKHCPDDVQFDKIAYCQIFFKERFPKTLDVVRPTLVKLSWNPQFMGSEPDIAPILDVCYGLKLQSYAPSTKQ